MFALFINNLGTELNSTGLGIELQNTIISTVFFADDLVLIAKSYKNLQSLMKITRTFFSNHHLTLSEKKSKTMVYDASTGDMNFSESGTIPELNLEKVIVFKYLGIPLNISPYGLFKSFNEQARKKAQSYLYSVLSLLRTGPGIT